MENKVKAYAGNLEVIGEGNVHISEERPLKLLIGKDLEMEFNFISDSSTKKFNTSYRTEGKKWIWELTNYDNPLGSGVLNPIEVGTLNSRKLFVSFFSWRPNTNSENRIVSYIVYQENVD
jgi:hypothetical protein